ncbi:MerR family transcriptional regulator [Streptomyces sp. NPDC047315]|uniref:MerR family transcriptional regulator n=1 Tax=Streptomyces sp. NPDC047315 TaxID=3155142 RepID=UPI0033C2ED5F
MFTIGDFARHGRVSARMLRHYDAIGLLRPEHTDPVTGYRHYAAHQLAALNRIIALKDLGFTLQEVGRVLGEELDVAELRQMLVARRAGLEEAMAAAAVRLTGVEARLRSIEDEGRLPVDEVVVKPVPAVRVAELTATAASYGPEHVGPVIQPLYDELFGRLAAAGVSPAGPGIAYYESAPDGGGAVVVHAAVRVTQESLPGPGSGVELVVLPALRRAATIVHRGSMDGIVPTSQALARWIDAYGHRSAGYAREVTLECPADPDGWVTELQEPLV